MKYSVGDKVVHPHYGPGRIINIEHRELLQEADDYYVIELTATGSTLYVPVHKMPELEVRPVMSRAKLALVLKTLKDVPTRLSKDFKKRQEKIRKKMATGRPVKLAEAVRDLTSRGELSHLTKVDGDLLEEARELLAVEMAMVTDSEILDAQEEIDAALEDALETLEDVSKNGSD
jgi:CarD family transcriptional regulator